MSMVLPPSLRYSLAKAVTEAVAIGIGKGFRKAAIKGKWESLPIFLVTQIMREVVKKLAKEEAELPKGVVEVVGVAVEGLTKVLVRAAVAKVAALKAFVLAEARRGELSIRIVVLLRLLTGERELLVSKLHERLQRGLALQAPH